MSIATLNKYKKQLKRAITNARANIAYYNEHLAIDSSAILDYQDQIEDIDTAITVLKMHLKRKK